MKLCCKTVMKNPSLYMLCHNLVFYTWMWLCMCVSVCLCLRNPLLNLNIEVFCSIKYSKCIQWLQSWCDVDNHFDYEKACDKIILILVYRQNLIYLRLYFNYIFIFIFLMVKIYFSKKKNLLFWWYVSISLLLVFIDYIGLMKC